MNTSDAARVIKNLARQNGVSVGEYRREIELALADSMASSDPAVQAYWAGIPRKGKRPTLEEVAVYMAKRVKSRL